MSCIPILSSMFSNHQSDMRPREKRVSQVIPDCHFNLPQGFVTAKGKVIHEP